MFRGRQIKWGTCSRHWALGCAYYHRLPPSPPHPNTPWKGPQLVPRFPEEEWGLHILEVEATTPVIGYRGEGST